MIDDDILSSEGYEWEGAPDLTSLSEDELRMLLKELSQEERDISYRRRVLQGRIDLIRAELVQRGGVTLTPEELARVLTDRGPGEQSSAVPRPEGRGGTLGEGG